MIDVLARYDEKWMPKDKAGITEVRRSLLRMKPDYTLDFVNTMSKDKACNRDDIEELLRTPAIRTLTLEYQLTIAKLVKRLEPHHSGRLNRKRL